jgi:hypothetical protein
LLGPLCLVPPGPKVQGSKGPRVQKFKGPRAHGSKRSRVQGSTGPKKVQGSKGPRVQSSRVQGPKGSRVKGPRVKQGSKKGPDAAVQARAKIPLRLLLQMMIMSLLLLLLPLMLLLLLLMLLLLLLLSLFVFLVQRIAKVLIKSNQENDAPRKSAPTAATRRSFTAHGSKSSRVKGPRVQKFKGPRAHGFKSSRVQGPTAPSETWRKPLLILPWTFLLWHTGQIYVQPLLHLLCHHGPNGQAGVLCWNWHRHRKPWIRKHTLQDILHAGHRVCYVHHYVYWVWLEWFPEEIVPYHVVARDRIENFQGSKSHHRL